MDSRSFICFGIDFGTTFSGVAWAWSGQPSEIYVVTSWPSKLYGNSDREKTPSEVYLNFPAAGRVSWGYDVPTHVEPLRWFKLLLVEEDELQPHLRGSKQLIEARERVRRENLQPVQVIAIYLRELWNHTLMHVRKSVRDAVDECRFHIVLTVPAIWRDAARQRMVEAAKLAGLLQPRACDPRVGSTTFDVVSEPEAGALSTFSTLEGRPDIQEGDAMIVVDAGGGTVDLISYRVDSVSPLTLSECVEGTGGLCGAVFLDQDFEKWISKRLANTWANISKSELKKMVNDCWEHGIKQEFNGDDREFTVTLPYSCAVTLNQPEITLKSGHIIEIFDNIVTQIEALVGQQISAVKKRIGKPPKYVILVGGFGRCQYLRVSLENMIDQRVTKVIQGTGPTPWTAICRGAVLHGLMKGDSLMQPSVRVSLRVSRANYGIVCSVFFVDGEHSEDDKFWCPFELVYKAHGQMEWYVERGEETSDLAPKQCVYHRTYDVDDPPRGFPDTSLTLYTSLDRPALPRFADSATIKPLCTIKFRYPLQFDEIPILTNQNGRRYRRVDFQLRMTTTGSSANFEIFTDNKSHGGTTQPCLGSKEIQVEYDELESPAPANTPVSPTRVFNARPTLRRSRVNLAALAGNEGQIHAPSPKRNSGMYSPFDTPKIEEEESSVGSSSDRRRSILYQMPSALEPKFRGRYDRER